MTFDDQLRRAFGTVTDGLRDDIARRVQVVIDELAAAALSERDRAAADARSAAERDGSDRIVAAVTSAVTTAVATAEARGLELVQEAETRAQEVARAAEARAREQGLDEGRAQGQQEGRALGEQQGRAQGEQDGRALGKEEGQHEAEARGREALAAARADSRASIVASSARLAEAISSIGGARSLSEILDTLITCVGREAARTGVVLIRGGRVHGWRFAGFDPPFDHDRPLDLPFGDVGIIAAAARTNSAVLGDGAGAVAPSFAALPPGRPCFAAPLALCGEVVAVLYADQGSTESPIPNHVIEVLTRHAARCLEATTAFKTARALVERPDARSVAPVSADETAADDDVAARRYARLLVSEIKLYHEAAVVDGRRERDLATRLGAEMARARVLYEQRVPPHVRQRADYFRDELVRTLADGDASLLEVRT